MHGQVDMGPEARITGSHWSAVGAGSLASDGLGMREACSQDAAQRSAARTAEGGRQRGEHQRAGSYTPHLSILNIRIGKESPLHRGKQADGSREEHRRRHDGPGAGARETFPGSHVSRRMLVGRTFVGSSEQHLTSQS